MLLQDIDKTRYISLSRKVSIVLIICFASTALLSSPVLIHFWGNPDGGNFYLNLAGVLIGVLLTSLVFSFYKNDPRLSDLLYVFRLKRMLARVTNRMHHLKKGVQHSDEDAQQILRFYYAGLLQVYYLESNEYGHSELEKEQQEFTQNLPETLKTAELIDLKPEFIEAVAKRCAV